MEANRSIEPLLKSLFCLHDGRSLPYYKHLDWELTNWPLNKLPLNSKKLLKLIKKIMIKGDRRTLKKVYLMCDEVFRKNRYTYSLNEWKNQLDKEISRF
ncbi:hypothetical protein COU54_04615 [Candidatus Pacearchaeota archaeon CG10_big_fil_rev_8_21_14_0_10_31_24]|nr:MAG: hypothetical protein COU54_04615 [Candidatus Pacearchaeota archaeon CG10_big_fil_rev_8_21_14_0_10_31_24]